MNTFYDYYNNEVKLSFADHPFAKYPKHVWVICRYNNQWLLTKHKDRGIEFPGGKVESGESAEQAAIREVKEETGGIVAELMYIGQYFVTGKRESIVKNIYFARVENLTKQSTYYETDGPVCLTDLPNDIDKNPAYSFIMKDRILPKSLEKIYQMQDF